MLINQSVTFFIVLLTPAIAPWISEKSRLPGILSPVVICYLIGIGLSNTLPQLIESRLSQTLSEVTVALAIPLLLVSSNPKSWIGLARPVLNSFVLCIIAVILSTLISTWIFQDRLPDAWRVGGMLAACYTGGTPNLNSVGLALEAGPSLLLMINATDIVCSAAYLIFLTTVGGNILGRLFRPFTSISKQSVLEQETVLLPVKPSPVEPSPVEPSRADKTANLIKEEIPPALQKPDKWWEIFPPILYSGTILGASAGITLLVMEKINPAVFFLILTILSLAASFVPKLYSLKGSVPIGDFLLLSFCVSIGLLTNFTQLKEMDPAWIGYNALLMGLALVLHFLFAWFARIDRDTLIITSTASVFGPPFVAQVSLAIKNRSLLAPGIIAGLLGYAIGNFLGIALAYFLKNLF